jgi:anti-anti-sigma factor
VKKLIPEHKRIVLDLLDLSHMDSSGLGALAALFVSARAAGCSLELMNLSHGIQKVLSLTNLMGVFTVIGENGLKVG